MPRCNYGSNSVFASGKAVTINATTIVCFTGQLDDQTKDSQWVTVSLSYQDPLTTSISVPGTLEVQSEQLMYSELQRADDRFGDSMDADNGILIIGSSEVPNDNSGSAYVYTFDETYGNYTFNRKLRLQSGIVPDPAAKESDFGDGIVRVQGSTIAVAAKQAGVYSQGGVLIYDRDQSPTNRNTFNLTGEVINDGPSQSSEAFAQQGCLNGDFLAVSAPNDEFFSGAKLDAPTFNTGYVTIFHRNTPTPNAWGPIKYILNFTQIPSSPGSTDMIWAGDDLIVGASAYNAVGAVFVFNINHGGPLNFGLRQTIHNPKPNATFGLFGWSTRYSPNTGNLIIGDERTPDAATGTNYTGGVWIYRQNTANNNCWEPIKLLQNSWPCYDSDFGQRVDVSDQGWVFVGADTLGRNSRGGSFAFIEQSDGSWKELERQPAVNYNPVGEDFGEEVAIDSAGGWIVTGRTSRGKLTGDSNVGVSRVMSLRCPVATSCFDPNSWSCKPGRCVTRVRAVKQRTIVAGQAWTVNVFGAHFFPDTTSVSVSGPTGPHVVQCTRLHINELSCLLPSLSAGMYTIVSTVSAVTNATIDVLPSGTQLSNLQIFQPVPLATRMPGIITITGSGFKPTTIGFCRYNGGAFGFGVLSVYNSTMAGCSVPRVYNISTSLTVDASLDNITYTAVSGGPLNSFYYPGQYIAHVDNLAQSRFGASSALFSDSLFIGAEHNYGGGHGAIFQYRENNDTGNYDRLPDVFYQENLADSAPRQLMGRM
eukprot:TRINITY_DN764_c0_g1_i2.p1 TRINITY_DN764_c0_g1~~TRINITY_DN764_c0_g1_i2.p1  ORF type:complete len:761 (+),score=174.41 TRINITY_DN764_c0_g1_i2:834-3116(+)